VAAFVVDTVHIRRYARITGQPDVAPSEAWAPMPPSLWVRTTLVILVAASGTGCQNWHIQPTDIQTIRSPAVKLEGTANIELETGEVVTDRNPSKGFGVADQLALVGHVKAELEASQAFLRINLNHEADSAYRIQIIFHRTVASGGDLSGIYNLDVELKIYDHGQLSLQRRYEVVTPEHEMLAFFVDATVRATKTRAANEVHRRVMQDINEWLRDVATKAAPPTP
jgi:hypothetical protein